jgi:hypothetical protein
VDEHDRCRLLTYIASRAPANEKKMRENKFVPAK